MSRVQPPVTTTATPATPRPREFEAAVRQRLVAPSLSDRGGGWAAPLLVTALAGLLRFWHLGRPASLVFDEKYYPQEAQSFLKYGVEYAVPYDGPPPNDSGPNFVVHPPLGKWVIALGEKAFGYDLHTAHPDGFGWRFSVALLGTLSVLVLCRTGRRLFRSTLLGCVAGLLLAVDGLSVVASRTALLDGILTFFVLCSFACVVADRDDFRARLAAGRAGGVRPWLLAAGVLVGMACATKWSGVFFLAAYAVLALVWSASARRTSGASRPYLDSLRHDVPVFVLYFALIPIAVYVASWTGWFLSDPTHAYDRGWAANPLTSLWHYQTEMWHRNVTLDTPHPYESNPWSWLVLGRPTAFLFHRGGPTPGCAASSCDTAITALGTPALWWAALPALVVLVYRMVGRRDWRAAAIVIAVLAGYLPWFHYQARTIFSFYAVVFAPYVALAVAMGIGLVFGGPDASPTRRTWGASAAGAYLLLVVANFAYFWPVLTGQPIPTEDWLARMWFSSWV